MRSGGETTDFLGLMVDCIACIEEYLHGFDKKQFVGSQLTHDAVIRRLIMIGECIKSLPWALKDQYTMVDWYRLVGIRDILVHDYWGIDMDLVYDLTLSELPLLRTQLFVIINARERESK
jgi:uncharacterized protein with HEPN domain